MSCSLRLIVHTMNQRLCFVSVFLIFLTQRGNTILLPVFRNANIPFETDISFAPACFSKFQNNNINNFVNQSNVNYSKFTACG